MPNRSLETMLDLKPGDHACCLYETEEEHRATVRSFLLGGLQQGEKVVYVMDGHGSDVISGYLADDGVDVEVCRASGQLVFLHWEDAYLRDGVFDPGQVIQLLQDGRLAGGYAALRVSGEMTWTLRGEAGSERLIEYEEGLNEVLPDGPCLTLCQYDRRRFEPSVLLDVLRTHPIAVVGTALYDNVYYIPPSDHRETAELSCWIGNLEVCRQTEKALWEAEEKNRQQERLAVLGQLAAGVSHDFNNLLTGIIGYAQLLEMRPDMPDVAKEDLGRIAEQGERAAHLIQQILDFSRASVIQRQPLDLSTFLKESIRFLRRTIPESIGIALEMGLEDCSVRADPTQVQQVLTNLVVNARDAMPDGGELQIGLSRLTVRSDEDPPCPELLPGEWVVLSVSDTGMGIAADHLPHIYEPFFTTKEAGEGTGLGLAQVYGIVTQHEGCIDEKSSPGHGTTFTVYLPALGETEQFPQERAREELPRGRGEMILVAEDDPIVLEMIGEMLRRLGYRALTATHGARALELYTKHRQEIVLVLADMVMPGMGSKELLRALKVQNPDVAMVVITGYPLDEHREELRAQGIVGWVRKPIDAGKLAGVLAEVLSGR